MMTYEELRQRHIADAAAMLPEMVTRIDWSADRLAEHRRTELQRLIRTARDLSPWHRKHLAEVNPDEVDEEMLRELPVMTKDDLMEHFDEIVTDDRLGLEVVEAHLAARTAGDAYLLDRYHACASGGSTGRRGVFVYDWDGWAVCYLTFVRSEVRARRLDPDLDAAPNVFGLVASESATHIGSSIPRTFSSPDGAVWHRFPITLPMAEIVSGLNTAQPTVLWGYSGALQRLAHEAATGRLRISPRRVLSSSEPLLPEIRAAAEEAWQAPVVNVWGTSEACCGMSCGQSTGTHLSDDLTIVEPVDADGRPVPFGVRSDKIYLTNLFNQAMPLIRYEVTDQLTFLDEGCPCGSVFQRIADPHGRLDDTFDYGGVTVHPHVFRAALSHHRQIVEYQVQQTRRGASIAICCMAPVDLPLLEDEIAAGLARLGLAAPDVTVTPVEGIERHAMSGKLKRFVPLPT